MNTIKKVLNFHNIPLSGQNGVSYLCDACQFGKAHALPFTKSNSRTFKPLYLVHTDLWGLAPIVFVDGYQYYICFVDDYNRFNWVYYL